MEVTGFQCRSCQSLDGLLVLDLGEQPLANNFLSPEDLDQPEPRFPLRLAVCAECWLLQITDLVPPVELFSEYVYFSSYSDAWVAHAAECAERYQKEFSHLGIEPADNVAAVARGRGVNTRVDFFTEPLARELAAEQPADLILANNVFAHAPDTNDFVAGLRELLSPEGRAVLEFPYAVDMIAQGEFDTIYHEHVFYFTITALEPLFARHGLRITQVERTSLHGGSLRIFVRHATYAAEDSVAELRATETSAGVNTAAFYENFAAQAAATRKALRAELAALRAAGQRVAAYGAAAKGSTLMNYCGLNAPDLEFVADRSPHKHGRLTPGTHVPVVDADELAKRAPDVTLLLAWNFADEILAQQAAYREAGGRFLIPIPEVRLI